MRTAHRSGLASGPLGSAAVVSVVATVLLELSGAVGSAGGGGGEVARLSRHKRYVVFPEGSTFTIAQCLTFTATTGNSIWTEGLNWAVSYDLPNETRSDRYQLDGFLPRAMVQRRHRRDLYAKLELLLDASGTNGRACVLRSLCEAAQRFLPGGSMLEEMLKVIFTVPLSRVLSWEPPEHTEYTAARRAGVDGHRCAQLYPTCPVSLLDLALEATQAYHGGAGTAGGDNAGVADGDNESDSNAGESTVGHVRRTTIEGM